MNITDITTKAGAKRKRKRVGRGESSGRGKTCGRGHKGAGARSGCTGRALAEGGMFPLFRRLPKFGFNNARFRTTYQTVNVEELEARFDDGGHVTAASLEEAGLIRDRADLVKILGDGELKKKLNVDAHRFSASAAAKIEASGGTVNWLAPRSKKRFVKRAAPPAKASSKSAKASSKSTKASSKSAKASSKQTKAALKGKKKGGKDKGAGATS